jgi:hypothetical protein
MDHEESSTGPRKKFRVTFRSAKIREGVPRDQ